MSGLKGMRSLLAALLVLVMTACAGSDVAWEPPGRVSNIGAYKLGPGDTVRVAVFGQQQLSGDFKVDGTGHVSLPLIGAMSARGETVQGLQDAIARKLADGYVKDPQVNVDVTSFRPFYIIGEVNRPGQYAYVNGMTAINAVAMAGGYTYRGRQDYVLVTRGNDPQKREYRAPVSTPVLPDDVIRIPERFF